MAKKYGANITAVDLLPKHVEIGRQRLKKHGLLANPDNSTDAADAAAAADAAPASAAAASADATAVPPVTLMQASAVDLPFPNASFSHVMCGEGLPHFHTREKFFHETWRVLKPGGQFTYSDVILQSSASHCFEPTPDGLSSQPRLNSGCSWLAVLTLQFTCWTWSASPANTYPPEVYMEKLRATGFVDVKMTSHNSEVRFLLSVIPPAARVCVLISVRCVMRTEQVYRPYQLESLSRIHQVYSAPPLSWCASGAEC
jgi:SAM-dependent methyltransferase